MIYIHKSTYADTKTIVLPKRVACLQTETLVTLKDFTQILKDASVIFTETIDKKITHIVHASNIKYETDTPIGNILNVNTNVKVIDLDSNKSLTSPDLVSTFIKDTFNFHTFLITKSSSHVEGRNNYKWHVWVLFTGPVAQKSLGTYISHKLPESSFIEELKVNKLGVQYKYKYNNLIDLKTFTSNGRKIAEHPKNTEVFQYGEELIPASRVNQSINQHIVAKRYIPNYKQEDIKNLHSSSLFKPTDILQKPNGEYLSVQDILDSNKNMRLVSPIDIGIKLSGDMQYYYKSQSFVDFNQGSKVYTVSYTTDNLIKYSSKYLPELNLTNDNTFILAPTGSGKTTAMRKSLKDTSIMIVPKTSIVVDQKGLISGFAKWEDLVPGTVNVMTFDKLIGHVNKGKDISEFNIIVDEVHTLFSDFSSHIRKDIYKKILLRGSKFKKLILLSATMDANLLPVKDLYTFRYMSTINTAHLQFIKNADSVYSMIKGRTLIFLQDRLKNASIYDTLKDTHNVLNLKSGDEIPKDLDKYDVIITTSVLREGFSITSHIDTVILYNINNAYGSYDLIQSIARPRINQPDIKIISATTHFTESDQFMPTISDLTKAAQDLVDGYLPTDIRVLHAISLESFKLMTLDIQRIDDHDQSVINNVGVISYYLELLYRKEVLDFDLMTHNLNEFLNCTTELTELDNDSSDLPQIAMKELWQRSKNAKTFEERDKVLDILNDLKETYAQAVEILSKYNDPIASIETKEGQRYLNEMQQCQYTNNPAMFSKINQHKKNINEGIYELLSTSRSWKYKDTFELRGLKRIFKVLDKGKKAFSDEETFSILKKVCRYDKIDKTGAVVKRGHFDYIKVNHKTLVDLSKKDPMKKTINVKGI